MKYQNIEKATFIDRPNRFIAHVNIDGHTETVHVKNTGRCKELLLPGVTVYLEKSGNPERKTAYDLVAVEKAGIGIINIDSIAPNIVAGEWLGTQNFDVVHPEFTLKKLGYPGNSRIDFYMERGSERFLMEVKGCTLERERIGYFPDAPTERGVKHLEELAKLARDGFTTALCFVIPMEGVVRVLPNVETHKEFGEALDAAVRAGVKILYLPCKVTADTLTIDNDKITTRLI